MRPSRPAPGFIKEVNVPPFYRFVLRTSDTIENELFGSLEFLSQIDEVGIAFFRRHGHTRNVKKTLLQFQSFIKQARTFYDAAEALHYRASALNYFYSFLNLAKAYITIFDPLYVAGHVYHGLSHKRQKTPLSLQFVVCRDGVFPRFYRAITDQEIDVPTSIKISDLLGYCSDVAYDYEYADFGPHRTIPCHLVIVSNRANNEYHILLACHGFGKLESYKKSLSPFFRYFEEVDLPRNNARQMFGITAEEMRFVRFFESKSTYPAPVNNVIPTGAMLSETHSALKHLFITNVYDDNIDFHLSMPLRINFQITMNEILAIYAVMFFLSDLVRYDPAYIESLLASRDAWIVERFVKTAPITFLRHMRNLIEGRDFVYKIR